MGGAGEAPEYISTFVKRETERGEKYAIAAVKGELLDTKWRHDDLRGIIWRDFDDNDLMSTASEIETLRLLSIYSVFEFYDSHHSGIKSNF